MVLSCTRVEDPNGSREMGIEGVDGTILEYKSVLVGRTPGVVVENDTNPDSNHDRNTPL